LLHRFTAEYFYMKPWVLFLLIFSFLPGIAQKKLLEQKTALDIVEKGLTYIYNTEQRKAEQYIHLVEELMPHHPVAPMMRALNTNWSSNPLETDSEEFNKLIGYLQLSLERTKNYLKRDPDDMEAIFFAMAIYGWLAQFYDEDGHTFKALGAAKNAYHYMKLGFERLDQSPEFYFSTGLYNYYRVVYPEVRPIYKPFVWFFRDGDKQLGLEQLQYASNHALFTKAESSMYLAHIYLRYENQPNAAVKYSNQLVKEFPKNTLFKVNHAESLLSARQYPEALPIIKQLLTEKKDFYRMSGEIFNGLYLENHLKNTKEATNWYRKALETGKDMGPRADNKKSLAYAGLARIAHANGEDESAHKFYKEALKLAQYNKTKEEAKGYLRDTP